MSEESKERPDPCPFCGGVAELEEGFCENENGQASDEAYSHVSCKDCGAGFTWSREGMTDLGRWNTRADEAKAKGMIDRAEVEKLMDVMENHEYPEYEDDTHGEIVGAYHEANMKAINALKKLLNKKTK